MLIHRQGLFDDDFDSLATRLDSSGQINTLNQILYPGFHAEGHSRDGFADALKRGALKAYKLPNNSLWDVRQHTELYFGPAQEGQGVEALTSQLVHEMGTYLVARWQLADGLNHQFYSEPWYRQAAILASEFSAGAIGVIQDFANLLATVGKALWRSTSGAFEVVVNLDIQLLKANFNQLAAEAKKVYGWVIESAEKLADMIAEGACMLKHALSLPRLASIVTAYLDGLTESLSTPQRARLIGSAAGEFGLDVLLTIFTLGAATAARHALRAGKAASAMVGPFSLKMLELIAKLSKMQALGVVRPSGLASFSEAVSPSQLAKANPLTVNARRRQDRENKAEPVQALSRVPEDIERDDSGVFGYIPKENSPFHSSRWPVDWTNDTQVRKARDTRLEYHRELNQKRDKIDRMRREGVSEEIIAKSVVKQRNLDRLSHYKTDAEKSVVYARNLKKYGDKLGPSYESQLSKYGSPTSVIEASVRSNESMDILTGVIKPELENN